MAEYTNLQRLELDLAALNRMLHADLINKTQYDSIKASLLVPFMDRLPEHYDPINIISEAAWLAPLGEYADFNNEVAWQFVKRDLRAVEKAANHVMSAANKVLQQSDVILQHDLKVTGGK